MKDTIETIVEGIRERVKNPFLPAFIVAWCAYNWKILIYGLSDRLSVSAKVSLIAQQLPEDYSAHWRPALYALGYAVVFPFAVVVINFVRRVPFDWDKLNTAKSELKHEGEKKRLTELQVAIAEGEAKKSQAEVEVIENQKRVDELSEAQRQATALEEFRRVQSMPKQVPLDKNAVEAFVQVGALSAETILELDGPKLKFVKRAVNNDGLFNNLRQNAQHWIALRDEESSVRTE